MFELELGHQSPYARRNRGGAYTRYSTQPPPLNLTVQDRNMTDLHSRAIKNRSKYALVYIAIDEEGLLQQMILPVHGKGLWSTLYGFLALDSDMTTINGFAFYEHGETPGLGGEVDNPRWKAQWIGKKAFDKNWNIGIEVLKGKVIPNDPKFQYRVDGLSGATITSRGVRDLLRYWLGENGFKPYLDRLRTSEVMDKG